MVVQSIKMAPLQGIPSERVRKIRDRMLSMPRELDIERARCYTRIYKQMEDAPPCMMNAKALEEFLRCLPIRIENDELRDINCLKRAKPAAVNSICLYCSVSTIVIPDSIRNQLNNPDTASAGMTL